MIQPLTGGEIREWTIGEWMEEARRMAAYLVSLDLPRGSKIAICSKNCAWWIMADVAIWMSGHVTVPIYPTLTPATVRYTLEHSEAKVLFVGKLDSVWEEMKTGVPEGMHQISFPVAPEGPYESWKEIVERHEPLNPAIERQPDELATIIYTSGSTGRPKGVMHDFQRMLHCTAGLSRAVEAQAGDRYLSYLPLAHGMERWMGECALLLHGEGEIYFAETIDTFLQDLQRARPTLFLSVPRLWSKFQLGVFAKMPPKKLAWMIRVPILGGIVKKKVLVGLGLDAVRLAGSGSAPISAELLQWYRDLGLEVREGYGMTENFNYSHITMPGEARAGYVGTPYDDVQCRIADDGEIQVKSPGNMIGYYKMPEATAETFTEDGWLRTGDRGEIDERGRLKITGRTKEIFKTSKGKYVAPAPIENKLSNHPRIELCCVGGAGYPQPHALVRLSEEAEALVAGKGRAELEADLAAHLESVNRQVDSFERLQFLALVAEPWTPENGLLTPTMKIRRNSIEETYQPHNDAWYESGKRVIWHA